MSNERIQVPFKTYQEWKEFGPDRKDIALRALQNEGYRALFMPQIADIRIEAPNDARIWNNYVYSVSAIINGQYKGKGDYERLIVHAPTSVSNPDYLTEQIEQGKLVDHAGIVPQEEFNGLRDGQDNSNIFAIQDKELKQWPNGSYGIDEPTKAHMKEFKGNINGKDMVAINHPLFKPSMGEEKRAIKYLERFKDIRGDKIGIWHSDDLHEQPLGRLLGLGNFYYGLIGYYSLGSGGHFVGVRDDVAQKILQPGLEEILAVLSDMPQEQYTKIE